MQKFFEKLANRIIALGGTAAQQPALFIDHKDIQSGAPWEQALGQALAESESFIFMISPAFVASQWCGKEVGIAHTRYSSTARHPNGCYLFPILWEVSPIQEMGGSNKIPPL